MSKIVHIEGYLKAQRGRQKNFTYRLYRRPKPGRPKKDWPWYLELYRGKAFSLKTTDEREAKDIRVEVMGMARGEKVFELEKGEKITLGQFRDEYLDACERMVEEGEIRPATARNDKYALRKFCDLVGADIPMRHVMRETVRRFKREYLELHGRSERAMRGCNTYMRHLSSAWDWAIRVVVDHMGMVIKPSYADVNPFTSERGRRGERMKFKVTSRLPMPLWPEEITAIRAAMYREFRRFMRIANDADLSMRERVIAKKHMQGVVETDRVFLCLLFSGMRIAEQVRFEERDILLSLNAVKVRSTETMGDGIKDFAERHIIMHPRLRNMFGEMYPDGLKTVGLNMLTFPRWTNKSSLSHRLAHFFALAGVRKPPKATRHTFASYQIASGTDIALLQRMMGHSSITTTHKYITALVSLKDGAHGEVYVKKMEVACRQFRYATGTNG